MRFLRTVSTRRLLALIAGVVSAIAGGHRDRGRGRRQRARAAAKPLAQRDPRRLAAPPVNGITARISVHEPPDRLDRTCRAPTRS